MLNVELKIMATLWENTYRAIVNDEKNNYLATVRIIVNVPIDEELLPPKAPTVEPQIFVLVEDASIDSKEIINFETLMSAQIMEKFNYQIQHLFYFYPSPEDMLTK